MDPQDVVCLTPGPTHSPTPLGRDWGPGPLQPPPYAIRREEGAVLNLFSLKSEPSIIKSPARKSGYLVGWCV